MGINFIKSSFFLLLVCSYSVKAATIYQQVWDGTNNNYASTVDIRALDSAYDPNTTQSFYLWSQVWNAFKLDPAVYLSNNVANVSWTGYHDSSLSLNDVNALFYIEISDAESINAPLLLSEEGSATETAIGSNFYSYSMDLSTALSLIIGHTYYISIQAEYELPQYGSDQEFANAIWNWSSSGAGVSLIYNNATNPVINGSLSKDFTFALNGDVQFVSPPINVTEPSTLWLIIGVSICFLAFRKKKLYFINNFPI